MSALGSAEVYTDDEVMALLEQITPASRKRLSPTSLRMRALIMLMWRTGLRISEALSLELRDLDLDAEVPTLRVREGKTNAAARVLGISADALGALHVWLGQRRDLPGEHVFCTLHGGPLDDSYVRAYLIRKGKAAGIRRCHTHAFRATLAVGLATEGHPIPLIRDVLGHRTIASTDAYLRRVFPEAAIMALASRT